jgi:CheY-like chemotaxis protein
MQTNNSATDERFIPSDWPALVVDDSPEIRACIQTILEDEGYEVMTAPDGATALELARHRPPGAILLDLMMPVMDGIAFMQAYRQTPGPHAPIILLTVSNDAPAEVRDLGGDSTLRKPFDLDRLLAKIQECMPPRSSRDAA